jgi:hypothetical protein
VNLRQVLELLAALARYRKKLAVISIGSSLPARGVATANVVWPEPLKPPSTSTSLRRTDSISLNFPGNSTAVTRFWGESRSWLCIIR